MQGVLLTLYQLAGSLLILLSQPWYERKIKVFGIVEVSMSFVVALGLLMVIAVVVLIGKGFIQEVKRKK
ncbi:MAG: hypothetical protein FWD45_01735 [Coriobacteriia bacterium]|nr:hypothetical protein [Coriobacteriia bacterium]